MNKTLTLDSPILINGKKVNEFEYNADEITTEAFLEACQKAAANDKSKTVSLKQKENDYVLHMYLGMAAVIAVNPEISFEDLERVKGFDTLKFTDIGWLFILRQSGETSKENNSVAPSENTAESSTQAQETSEKAD